MADRTFYLWLAPDGEVRVSPVIPVSLDPRTHPSRFWLPSGEAFTKEEADGFVGRHTNLSRADNRTNYLDGGGPFGGPWDSAHQSALLERFERVVKAYRWLCDHPGEKLLADPYPTGY